jgi:hypothetical protein
VFAHESHDFDVTGCNQWVAAHRWGAENNTMMEDLVVEDERAELSVISPLMTRIMSIKGDARIEDDKLGNCKKRRAETTGQKIRTLQGREQRADSLGSYIRISLISKQNRINKSCWFAKFACIFKRRYIGPES